MKWKEQHAQNQASTSKEFVGTIRAVQLLVRKKIGLVEAATRISSPSPAFVKGLVNYLINLIASMHECMMHDQHHLYISP